MKPRDQRRIIQIRRNNACVRRRRANGAGECGLRARQRRRRAARRLRKETQAQGQQQCDVRKGDEGIKHGLNIGGAHKPAE